MQCGPNVKKLKIKFRQNPFVGEPNPNVLCIGGCDLTVLETLNINPSSVRSNNNSKCRLMTGYAVFLF